jgi:hypothetical protein
MHCMFVKILVISIFSCQNDERLFINNKSKCYLFTADIWLSFSDEIYFIQLREIISLYNWNEEISSHTEKTR